MKSKISSENTKVEEKRQKIATENVEFLKKIQEAYEIISGKPGKLTQQELGKILGCESKTTFNSKLNNANYFGVDLLIKLKNALEQHSNTYYNELAVFIEALGLQRTYMHLCNDPKDIATEKAFIEVYQSDTRREGRLKKVLARWVNKPLNIDTMKFYDWAIQAKSNGEIDEQIVLQQALTQMNEAFNGNPVWRMSKSYKSRLTEYLWFKNSFLDDTDDNHINPNVFNTLVLAFINDDSANTDDAALIKFIIDSYEIIKEQFDEDNAMKFVNEIMKIDE
jgi:hypothetical protein